MNYSFLKFTVLITNIILTLVISSTLVFSSWVIPVKKAEAGGAGSGLATEFSNLQIKAEASVSAVKNSAIAGFTGISAANSTSQFIRENLLNGIAWAIAKQMVANMTKSMVNWINSGFQGSPAFIGDLNEFLLNALDQAAGNYIQSLGDTGSFICSPFKLDVQAALSINYAQTRSGMPSGPTACTLTGIKDNIKNFMQGSMSGWGQWLSVTSNPQNTPYGAYLEAESKLNARLINEKGQQIQIANWGDGFLSKKICEGVNGEKTTKGQHCRITTPGKVISEALTFQLSTGPRSLIAADQINEVIGALINQLTLKAMQGVNGLLGLSSGTGYTDYSYADGTTTIPYIDAAADSATQVNTTAVTGQITRDLASEQSFFDLASVSNVEATRRLPVIISAQNAINTIFNGPNHTASLIGVTQSDTPDDAVTKLKAYPTRDCNSVYYGTKNCNGFGSSPAYTTAKTEISDMNNKIDAVTKLSKNLSQGQDLKTVTLGILINKSHREQVGLQKLISDTNELIPNIQSNIDFLNSLMTQYDTADTVATSTQAFDKIRGDIVLRYTDAKNSGILSDPAIIENKRTEWDDLLP